MKSRMFETAEPKQEVKKVTRNKIIYCHFSFKRPKDKDYGLFAVALYADFEGKKLIGHITKRKPLWEDHQFVTAIQAYSIALDAIFRCQGKLIDLGVSQVMLVTDNSTLEGWIVNPKKNKNYTAYMDRAVEPYRLGAPKEIVLGIGLCEARKSEKSYKYCKEELVCNDGEESKEETKPVVTKIDITPEYKSIFDMLRESNK